MAKKSMLFVLLAFVLLFSATAVLADQEGTAVWCNIDEYGCWNTGDNGEKEYCMFWSEDAATLFMGPNSGATVTPRPKGSKLAMKGPFWFDRTGSSWVDADGFISEWSAEYWSCVPDSSEFTGGWNCTGKGHEDEQFPWYWSW